MKKALVSAAGPNMAPVLALAAVTFKKFAAIHNYDLVLNNYVADSPELLDALSQQAKWQKVALLESLLPDYDLVVWMDADIVITRFDKDIAKQVPQDCFQAFVLEHYEDRFNPHTAVWAMRNEEMSYNFLREVQLLKTQHSWAEPAVDSWAEQAAVCVALGWQFEKRHDRTYAKPAFPSEFLPRTGWMRPEWNPNGYAAMWPVPARTAHFSMPHAKRVVRMRRVLRELGLDEGSA